MAQTTVINRLYLEDDASVTAIPVPKFTNIDLIPSNWSIFCEKNLG